MSGEMQDRKRTHKSSESRGSPEDGLSRKKAGAAEPWPSVADIGIAQSKGKDELQHDRQVRALGMFCSTTSSEKAWVRQTGFEQVSCAVSRQGTSHGLGELSRSFLVNQRSLALTGQAFFFFYWIISNASGERQTACKPKPRHRSFPQNPRCLFLFFLHRRSHRRLTCQVVSLSTGQ